MYWRRVIDRLFGEITFKGLAVTAATLFAFFVFSEYVEQQISTYPFEIAIRSPFYVYRNLRLLLIPLAAFILSLMVLKLIWEVRQDSRDYASKISKSSSLQTPEIVRLLASIEQSSSEQIKNSVAELRAELDTAKISPAAPSTPDKLFQMSRQRLLDEAVRTNSISQRNLVIGIVFSFIALGTLAWPLLVQSAIQTSTDDPGVVPWFARYYLPRFAVGLLLQLVGFFFLRLYVANELDLKHNKNELTNIEMKTMALHLAKEFGDAASKKEIMKSLAATERNFIIKKNEKSISTEALSEYNDLKGIFEKLISKIPGTK